MTADDFYSKWNINISTVSYYKKRFPQFVENKRLNYEKLNAEFERRIKLKNKARAELYSTTGSEIKDCFEGKNNHQMACHWLRDLYLDYITDKHSRHLITDKALDRIEKVLKHLGKDK